MTSHSVISFLVTEKSVPVMLAVVMEAGYGALHAGWGSWQEPTSTCNNACIIALLAPTYRLYSACKALG